MSAQHIAWINGASVAIGSLEDVERKALETIATPRWQEFNPQTILRITFGTAQHTVKEYTIQNLRERSAK